jgi:AcrR family transcriptional regulator
MGRTAMFTVDALLDAARDVVLAHGLRGTTIASIAAQAGAPVGSLYHRFSSVHEILARAWLRAATATQQVHLHHQIDDRDPVDAAAELSVAYYDYCIANPKDVLLLDRISPGDLASFNLSEQQQSDLAQSNAEARKQIAAMARRLFGTADARACDAVVLALVDLPASFARRYLESGKPPASRREQLPRAVRAVLSS